MAIRAPDGANKLWLETAIASTIVRHLYDFARPLTKFDSPTFVSKLEEGFEPELIIHIMKNSRLFILYGASKGLYFEWKKE